MIILITPALEGLRPEWEEAAESLGATRFSYLRHVAAPVMAPSFIGSLLILFGNAFSAYATALALVGVATPSSSRPQIYDAINGNVLVDASRIGAGARRRDDLRCADRHGRVLVGAAPRTEVAAVSVVGGGGPGAVGAGALIGELAAGPRRRPLPRRRARPRYWRVTIFVLAAIFFLVPLLAAFKFSLSSTTASTASITTRRSSPTATSATPC